MSGMEEILDGAGLLARELAGEYGITYRTPGFAIHREGRYGKIVGRSYTDRKEYGELLRAVRDRGGNFVKIMTTGIMDFSDGGRITGESAAPGGGFSGWWRWLMTQGIR